MKKLLLPIVSLLFAACGGGSDQSTVTTSEDGRITILLDDADKTKLKLNLSDLVDDLEVLQLDADVANAVDAIVYMSDDYIIARLNSKGQLKLFNSQTGKFIANVGTKGRGRGEYLNTNSIYVDEEAERIYLLNIQNVNIYNFEGKFLDYIPIANKVNGLCKVLVDTKAKELTVIGTSANRKIIVKQNFEGEEISSIKGDINDNIYTQAILLDDNEATEFFLNKYGVDCKSRAILRYDAAEAKIDTTAVITFRDFDDYKGESKRITLNNYKFGDYLFSNISKWENDRMSVQLPPVLVNTKDGSFGRLQTTDDILGVVKFPSLFQYRGDYLLYPKADPYRFLEDVDAILESDIEDDVYDRLYEMAENIDEDGNMVIIRGKAK